MSAPDAEAKTQKKETDIQGIACDAKTLMANKGGYKMLNKRLFLDLLIASQLLLCLDYYTTTIILGGGGVELNPIVNWVGLDLVSVLKNLGGLTVACLSWRGQSYKPLLVLLGVFYFVVSWNTAQIIMWR